MVDFGNRAARADECELDRWTDATARDVLIACLGMGSKTTIVAGGIVLRARAIR